MRRLSAAQVHVPESGLARASKHLLPSLIANRRTVSKTASFSHIGCVGLDKRSLGIPAFAVSCIAAHLMPL